jgi:integrase
VVERKRKTGVYYGIRFIAGGRRRYQKLGPAADGWTRKRAEAALQDVMTDVRRGVWVDPQKVEPTRMPTFHEFASEWLADQKLQGGRRGRGLSEAGSADLEWRLSFHLLPWFADKMLDEISIEDVDRYRLSKMRQGKEIRDAAAKGNPIMYEYTDRRGCRHRRAARPLSVTSINKTLATLAAILDRALERGLVARNPATVGGKRRRLSSVVPPRSWLDRADHIAAMLAGARQLDERATERRGQRRALLATLVFAGLRIGEALALRWSDIDLARGTITIRAAKTDAGVRTVNVLPVLRDELDDYRARASATPDALVFGSSTGRRQGATNVRRRVLAKAVELANEQVATNGLDPLPVGLTPHSLRRTFASLLFAVGEPPPYVMAQMGHTTANFTLAIYARQMDRRDGEPERLKALVNGVEWAQEPARAAADRHQVGTRELMAVEATRA